MTRDELQQRMILIEPSPRPERTARKNIRIRDENYIEIEDEQTEDLYDDFFEYEKDMMELTPARDTVAEEFDLMTKDVDDDNGFLVMEESLVEEDESESENEQFKKDEEELPFKFIRCSFIKDDGEQCKKQAKKGNKLCGIHRRYVDKQK